MIAPPVPLVVAAMAAVSELYVPVGPTVIVPLGPLHCAFDRCKSQIIKKKKRQSADFLQVNKVDFGFIGY
jgi:hypothetical protein